MAPNRSLEQESSGSDDEGHSEGENDAELESSLAVDTGAGVEGEAILGASDATYLGDMQTPTSTTNLSENASTTSSTNGLGAAGGGVGGGMGGLGGMAALPGQLRGAGSGMGVLGMPAGTQSGTSPGGGRGKRHKPREGLLFTRYPLITYLPFSFIGGHRRG